MPPRPEREEQSDFYGIPFMAMIAAQKQVTLTDPNNKHAIISYCKITGTCTVNGLLNGFAIVDSAENEMGILNGIYDVLSSWGFELDNGVTFGVSDEKIEP